MALGQTGAINGDANTAAQFDGTNDFAPATRQIGNDFSIELWFKSTQGVGTGAQWWRAPGWSTPILRRRQRLRRVPALRWQGGRGRGYTGGLSRVDSGRLQQRRVAPRGVHPHQSNGALALYIDGLPAGTGTGNTLALTSSATLSLGRVQGLAYLNGTLDEVALYNTVLSAATVAAHHAAGF